MRNEEKGIPSEEKHSKIPEQSWRIAALSTASDQQQIGDNLAATFMLSILRLILQGIFGFSSEDSVLEDMLSIIFPSFLVIFLLRLVTLKGPDSYAEKIDNGWIEQYLQWLKNIDQIRKSSSFIKTLFTVSFISRSPVVAMLH